MWFLGQSSFLHQGEDEMHVMSLGESFTPHMHHLSTPHAHPHTTHGTPRMWLNAWSPHAAPILIGGMYMPQKREWRVTSWHKSAKPLSSLLQLSYKVVDERCEQLACLGNAPSHLACSLAVALTLIPCINLATSASPNLHSISRDMGDTLLG